MAFWTIVILSVGALLLYALMSDKPGMQKEYRDRAIGFADLLRYASIVEDGVVQGKGGELIAGFFYRGMDTESADNYELQLITNKLNAVMARFGSGWMVHIDAIRDSATGYPEEGQFPHPVFRLMDQERREQYEQEGRHYESRYALLFTYLPPLRLQSKAQAMMFERSSDLEKSAGSLADQLRNKFQDEMREIEAQLKTIFDDISRMNCHVTDEAGAAGTPILVDDLTSYLLYCTTGIRQPMRLPEAGVYLDSVVGSQDFTGGNHPRVGSKHIRAVSIEGFPSESYPGILDTLNTLPVAYRWNTRFIFLEPEEGRSTLDRMRKQWRQKIRGLKDQMLNTQSGAVDEDALEMTVDAQHAMSEVNSGLVRYGHYTSVVVLMDEDQKVIEENALEVAKRVRNLGFAARIETINTVEAFLGSLPGHGYENVRRPIIHSLNLAHLVPTTAAWPGQEFNPCPFYPKNSPPLFFAATTGNAPFRVSLHVGDVGHTLLLGPTGAGKSTDLEFKIAQHFRYPRAKVFVFDKGYSAFILCHAAGGHHYDIGSDHQKLSFCPLGQVNKPNERIWAEGYIEMLLALQGVSIMPAHRNAIRQALMLLGESDDDLRTMTHFVNMIQDQTLQEALYSYSLAGSNDMLDAVRDEVRTGYFQVFEMEHLMSMGERHIVPVLLYLFHCIERQLDGSPVLLVLDEAWLMLEHRLFQDKIKEWLKVMRKANVAVIFATQSISDVGKSAIRDVVYESCLTKILLPNTEARNEASHEQYIKLGLNERQIDMIASATPKRDYYYTSPLGKRMYRLGLGPLCLAFVGASSKDDVKLARELMARHGDRWTVEWLKGRRLADWAKALESQVVCNLDRL
jgi:type IV secretion system protein VirB4